MRPPLLTGKEEFDRDNLIGIGVAVTTMLLIAMQLIIIRTLKVHHGVANAFAMLWTLVQGFILSITFGYWEVAETNEIIGLSVVGLSLGIGLTCLVLALQVEEAGVVALIRTSEVIFVFLWQYIIVGTLPDWISILGAVLVISGVVTVSLRKWIETLPKKSPLRRKLRFLLL